MKFAAVDIGSNAIRLLFYNVYDDGDKPIFKKVSLTRLPIRLGEDVFSAGVISEEKIKKLIKSMIAFRNLMEVHDVLGYRVYATSAMREAENSLEIIQRVYFETGVEIHIIDGTTEAGVIYSNHIERDLDPNKSYMYIDVGGGSTEINYFSRNNTLVSASFNIGTVRSLKNKIRQKEWKLLKDSVKDIKSKSKGVITGIGSGGNINKIFKLSGLKDGRPLTVKRLRDIYQMLSDMSYYERTHTLGLNADRADVIVPAAEIFLYICKYADIKTIYVPKIGLSDGIIRELYEEYKLRQNAEEEDTN
jgi:exopolyphosphatase/guanosine-5'-triphosphate,3'-diphosphate pyrophosphatase